MFFSELFTKYRLKSEFLTLSELGNALYEKGYFLEDSTFSRWQGGGRIPQNRNLLIALIAIFIEKKGIASLKEVNELLESAGQGYLTESEIKKLPQKVFLSAPFQVPREIDSFVNRETYIDNVWQYLSKGKIVVISGPAGMGKTALAIKIAHMLRSEFSSGVLWYRVDVSDPASILSAIASSFGENINNIKDVNIRASIVRSILSDKRALLILDNAEPDDYLHLFIPNSEKCAVIITSRYKEFKNLPAPEVVNLESFKENESFLLFEKILGKKYTKRNRENLLCIFGYLGGLPLAVSIFAKQLLQPSSNIRKIVSSLKKQNIKLDRMHYDNKDFYSSLNTGYSDLDSLSKKIFTSLSIFDGTDFSASVVAFVNDINMQECRESLVNLAYKSFIEHSVKDRYRLHPLMRIFAHKKAHDLKSLYKKTAQYYHVFFKKIGRGNAGRYPEIEVENDNVFGIFNKCCKLGIWNGAVNIWEYYGVFLWDTGRWHLTRELGEKAYKVAFKIKDKHARARFCISGLSWLYFWQGDINKAKKFGQEGLELAEELDDAFLIAYAKQRLGKIRQAERTYSESLNLLKTSCRMFKKMNELERLGDTLTYIGEIYWLTKDYRQAKTYLTKAFEVVDKIKDVPQKAIISSYWAGLLLSKGKYQEAEKFFLLSINLAKKIGRRTGGEIWNNIGLGLIAEHRGNTGSAIDLYNKAKREMLYLGVDEDYQRTSAFMSALAKQISQSMFHKSPSHS